MIGFQPLGPKRPNFFRIVFANAWSTSEATLDALLKRMDAYGQEVRGHQTHTRTHTRARTHTQNTPQDTVRTQTHTDANCIIRS